MIDEGLNSKEIAPVTIKTRRGEHTVTIDEQPHKANLEKIPQLRPAFAEGGTITPANSSSILTAQALYCWRANLRRVRMGSRHGQGSWRMLVTVSHPNRSRWLPSAPRSKCSKRRADGIRCRPWEVNEAFAMVTMLTTRALDLDPACVNVHGGACARVTLSAPPARALS